jgi:hypothetical protein
VSARGSGHRAASSGGHWNGAGQRGPAALAAVADGRVASNGVAGGGGGQQVGWSLGMMLTFLI